MLSILKTKSSNNQNQFFHFKGGVSMMLKVNIKDIENRVLNPLNEILLLSYGTDVYKVILGKIEKTVLALEKQHLNYKRWQ